jgi:hypothetical protein
MNAGYNELPDGAQALLAAIAQTIDEARPLLGDAPPELAYNITETEARYVPDVIAAFLAVPRSQRSLNNGTNASAEELLLRELSIIHRSVKRDLERLSEERVRALSAQNRFLSARFNDASNTIETPENNPPQLDESAAARWFSTNSGASAAEIVANVAKRLRDAFPTLVTVRGTGLFGLGAVRDIEVTIPQDNGVAFRFTLGDERGRLKATVTKLVHETPIQTISCSSEEWLGSLHDELAGFTRRHREMTAPFIRLFS